MAQRQLRGKLITAEDFHAAPEGWPDLTPAARTLVWHSQHFQMTGEIPRLEGNIDHTIQVEVFVSAGRWCAACPWCPASEYPSATSHFFMCSQCHNNGSLVWVLTKWPERRWEIEEILTMRPDPRTRNWLPGETPERLAQENEDHLGIPTFTAMNYEKAL